MDAASYNCRQRQALDMPGKSKTRADKTAATGRPHAYRPQLATLVDAAPSGDDWLHELKYDGYRLGVSKVDGDVGLETRRGNDWTTQFPEVVEAVKQLNIRSVLLDGEVTALLLDGRTSFQALQKSFDGTKRPQLAYFAFDLLHLEGQDTALLPLEERKHLLQQLIASLGADSVIKYSEHVVGDGAHVLKQACMLGAEGIVSKRRRDPYRPGRNSGWVKAKCVQRQEFVVGGFTDPEGSRLGVGSMLIGYYDASGKLAFAGKVGTAKGFGLQFWRELRKKLEELEQPQSPFTPKPPGWLGKHAHWVKPQLVIEVEFTEWTESGQIRHPSLQGFRQDKPATDVVREQARAISRAELRGSQGTRRNTAGSHQHRDADTVVAGVQITNPGRMLYPALGLTKLDVARFYADTAEWMLPHVLDRPLTLVRCEHGASEPDALRTQCQFLRHTNAWHRWVPEYVRRVAIVEQHKTGEYLAIDSTRALVAIINGDILELHAWNATTAQLEKPDRLVFDLDPAPDVAWSKMIDAAFLMRDRLAAVGLQSWVKTTGGKGLHVVVPILPTATWDVCFAFSAAVAQSLVNEHPKSFTTTFGKARRPGKILLDYKRNHRAAVAVSAFSTRARPTAPVSFPVGWDELSGEPSSERYTVVNLPAVLKQRDADPWADYWRCKQSLQSAVEHSAPSRSRRPARSRRSRTSKRVR
jgi:bifunctional non-homologous end joining protein LigD